MRYFVEGMDVLLLLLDRLYIYIGYLINTAISLCSLHSVNSQH